MHLLQNKANKSTIKLPFTWQWKARRDFQVNLLHILCPKQSYFLDKLAFSPRDMNIARSFPYCPASCPVTWWRKLVWPAGGWSSRCQKGAVVQHRSSQLVVHSHTLRATRKPALMLRAIYQKKLSHIFLCNSFISVYCWDSNRTPTRILKQVKLVPKSQTKEHHKEAEGAYLVLLLIVTCQNSHFSYKAEWHKGITSPSNSLCM